jgi:hypothetical protein
MTHLLWECPVSVLRLQQSRKAMGCYDETAQVITTPVQRGLHVVTWYNGSCDPPPSNSPQSLQHDYALDAINVRVETGGRLSSRQVGLYWHPVAIGHAGGS